MTIQDEWAEVADRIGGLAMKLKLHYEETTGDVAADARVALDTAVDGVAAAFDGLKAASKDPAIKQDVSDVAAILRDAVHNTFAEVSAQLRRTTPS